MWDQTTFVIRNPHDSQFLQLTELLGDGKINEEGKKNKKAKTTFIYQ